MIIIQNTEKVVKNIVVIGAAAFSQFESFYYVTHDATKSGLKFKEIKTINVNMIREISPMETLALNHYKTKIDYGRTVRDGHPVKIENDFPGVEVKMIDGTVYYGRFLTKAKK